MFRFFRKKTKAKISRNIEEFTNIFLNNFSVLFSDLIEEKYHKSPIDDLDNGTTQINFISRNVENEKLVINYKIPLFCNEDDVSEIVWAAIEGNEDIEFLDDEDEVDNSFTEIYQIIGYSVILKSIYKKEDNILTFVISSKN